MALLLVQVLCACDYARMNDDEAFDTYQTRFPDMPVNSVPATGGIQALKVADLETVKNPLPPSAEVLARGKERYGFYCVHCHGARGDGQATVGQSFVPLPKDLNSPYVQNQSDGEMFYKINLGFQRHPPLANTISPDEGWAVIHYIRSLGKQQQSRGQG